MQDLNELARVMRARALLIEGDPTLNESSLRKANDVRIEAEKKKKRLRDMKQLYFDAGRWVGGAKDHTARQAFEAINGRDPWLLK